MASATETRGLKRVCVECGTRFYDFNKRPIACPSCAVEYTGDFKVKSRRGRSTAANDDAGQVRKAKAKEVAVEEDDEDEIEEEEDIISLDDVEEDDDDEDEDDSKLDDDDDLDLGDDLPDVDDDDDDDDLPDLDDDDEDDLDDLTKGAIDEDDK